VELAARSLAQAVTPVTVGLTRAYHEHIKVFCNDDAAETWFEENDPEGVASEYEVLE
jgi:hypothetical protein